MIAFCCSAGYITPGTGVINGASYRSALAMVIVTAIVAVIIIVIPTPVVMSVRVVQAGVKSVMIAKPVWAVPSPVSKMIWTAPVKRMVMPTAVPWGVPEIRGVIEGSGTVSEIYAYSVIMWVKCIKIHVCVKGVVIAEAHIRPVKASYPRSIRKIVVIAIEMVMYNYLVFVFIVIIFFVTDFCFVFDIIIA